MHLLPSTLPGNRIGAFAALSIVSVLGAPVLLALHAWLLPFPGPTSWLIVEVGLGVVLLNMLFAALFIRLEWRAFIIALTIVAFVLAAIAIPTEGHQLLHHIYIDKAYIPAYYTETSIAITVLLTAAWEMIRRTNARSTFMIGMAVATISIVAIPGYLFVYRQG